MEVVFYIALIGLILFYLIKRNRKVNSEDSLKNLLVSMFYEELNSRIDELGIEKSKVKPIE